MGEQVIQLLIYQTQAGHVPFESWMNQLNDAKTRAVIHQRLNRIRIGNTGNIKSVGKGVFELKIDLGPGYRIYFGQQNSRIIILLCGGDKTTQQQDIRKAQRYWDDYSS